MSSGNFTIDAAFISWGGQNGVDPLNSWNYELAQIIKKPFYNNNSANSGLYDIFWNLDYLKYYYTKEYDNCSHIFSYPVDDYLNYDHYFYNDNIDAELYRSCLQNIFISMCLPSSSKFLISDTEWFKTFDVSSLDRPDVINMPFDGAYIQRNLKGRYLAISYFVYDYLDLPNSISYEAQCGYSLSVDGGETQLALVHRSVKSRAFYNKFVKLCDIYDLNTSVTRDVRITRVDTTENSNPFFISFVASFDKYEPNCRPLMIWKAYYLGRNKNIIEPSIIYNQTAIYSAVNKLIEFGLPVFIYDAEDFLMRNPLAYSEPKMFATDIANKFKLFPLVSTSPQLTSSSSLSVQTFFSSSSSPQLTLSSTSSPPVQNFFSTTSTSSSVQETSTSTSTIIVKKKSKTINPLYIILGTLLPLVVFAFVYAVYYFTRKPKRTIVNVKK